MPSKTAFLAIGGNSLIRAGQRGTIEEQFENAQKTAEYIVELIKMGFNLVITHGNGPQVGAQLIRSELGSGQVYSMPLDVCVASTQGEIGYILQNSIQKVLWEKGFKNPVITIITQVVVNEDDPAFKKPTKPVGPFYTKEEAQKKRQIGWEIIEDAGRGYRRVVPSPKPIDIVEKEAIRQCLNDGMIVIAVGGGGIPVIKKNGKYIGVEAVIDKDRASAVLAKYLEVDYFIISTDTDKVYLNYKKPEQKALDVISVDEIKKFYLEGHFPPGSMGPKIEAVIDFIENGGECAIITSPENLTEAVFGNAGTKIIKSKT
ncbi:carbamate kinase [Candidatus Kryptobacter tengchongensis]|nr:carbamate kinase [Candidatus Kryptobacter tengchongensis]